MATKEVYKLNCWRCEREVEIEAGPADRPEVRECPHCRALLELDWRGAVRRLEGRNYIVSKTVAGSRLNYNENRLLIRSKMTVHITSVCGTIEA